MMRTLTLALLLASLFTTFGCGTDAPTSPYATCNEAYADSSQHGGANGEELILLPFTIDDFLPHSATAGSTIIISGANFPPRWKNISVWFGKQQAKILSVTCNELRVEVPQGATAGPIAVRFLNREIPTNYLFTPSFSSVRFNLENIVFLMDVYYTYSSPTEQEARNYPSEHVMDISNRYFTFGATGNGGVGGNTTVYTDINQPLTFTVTNSGSGLTIRTSELRFNTVALDVFYYTDGWLDIQCYLTLENVPCKQMPDGTIVVTISTSDLGKYAHIRATGAGNFSKYTSTWATGQPRWTRRNYDVKITGARFGSNSSVTAMFNY